MQRGPIRPIIVMRLHARPWRARRRGCRMATQRTVPGSGEYLDPVTTMMSSLLPVHAALTFDWLVDAACTAAERGLNAPYAFVFLEDQEGRIEHRMPAGDLRRRGVQRAVDAFGENPFRGKLDPNELPLVAEALDTRTPVRASTSAFFTPLVGASRADMAEKKLGLPVTYLTALETAGERIGAILLLMQDDVNPQHVKLLAEHIACAAVNLRQSHVAREQGVIDVVRSVFDARKLEMELQRELARAGRYQRETSICVIEATNLRLLREKFGRFLTDQLLQRLGERLAQHARDIDVIGAYKESGYTMILTEASGEGAAVAARRLFAHAQDSRLDGDNVPGLELHLVVGYATAPHDGQTSDALFAVAERRMYSRATDEQVA